MGYIVSHGYCSLCTEILINSTSQSDHVV